MISRFSVTSQRYLSVSLVKINNLSSNNNLILYNCIHVYIYHLHYISFFLTLYISSVHLDRLVYGTFQVFLFLLQYLIKNYLDDWAKLGVFFIKFSRNYSKLDRFITFGTLCIQNFMKIISTVSNIQIIYIFQNCSFKGIW